MEDEAIVADDIALSLENMGYDISSVVSSGEKAVQKAGTERPDLVLMDIMLDGDMDGIEAAYKIQTLFDIPVVYLTAYSDENIIKRAGETASYGYLIKPFNKPELYTSIEIAISKSKMERKVRESEERFREVVEGTGDLITRVDGQGKILYVNHMALRVFGVDINECIGMSAFRFIHPDDRDKTEKQFKECVQSRLPQASIDNRQVNVKTGEVHHMSWTSNFYYDKDGKVERINGIAHDITLRKKADEERERFTQALDQKNRELEQIIYVTSHDLRSPLLNIYGYSKDMAASARELASAINEKGFPEEIREKFKLILNKDMLESVKYINVSIYKIESLLNGLLKVARAGQIDLNKEKLDMNSLLSDIISIIRFKSRETSTKIETTELPPCTGDRTQIDQIFSNLIGNAMKYMDPERAGIIKISGHENNGQSVYCVEDNGIGIAAEHQEKIFNIFHQVKPDERTGEGLGLTIVRKIVERHHGNIRVESEPGKGSRFYVSLPA